MAEEGGQKCHSTQGESHQKEDHQVPRRLTADGASNGLTAQQEEIMTQFTYKLKLNAETPLTSRKRKEMMVKG
jgi:hypothetical protein